MRSWASKAISLRLIPFTFTRKSSGFVNLFSEPEFNKAPLHTWIIQEDYIF